MPDQESATPGTSETAQVQPAPEHVHTEPGPTSATTQSLAQPKPTSASGGGVFVGTAFSTISSKMPDPVPEPAPPLAPGQKPAPAIDPAARIAALERERLGLIGVAVLAGCGRMTASDVLMSLTAPVTPESAQQKLGAALEAARQRLGPAVANPLIEQAGLDVPGGQPTMREPEATPAEGQNPT